MFQEGVTSVMSKCVGSDDGSVGHVSNARDSRFRDVCHVRFSACRAPEISEVDEFEGSHNKSKESFKFSHSDGQYQET